MTLRDELDRPRWRGSPGSNLAGETIPSQDDLASLGAMQSDQAPRKRELAATGRPGQGDTLPSV